MYRKLRRSLRKLRGAREVFKNMRTDTTMLDNMINTCLEQLHDHPRPDDYVSSSDSFSDEDTTDDNITSDITTGTSNNSYNITSNIESEENRLDNDVVTNNNVETEKVVRVDRINDNLYRVNEHEVNINRVTRTMSDGGMTTMFYMTIANPDDIVEGFNMMQEVAIYYKRDNGNIPLYAYQFIIYGNGKYYNKSNVTDLDLMVEEIYNKYDNNAFIIDEITIVFSLLQQLPRVIRSVQPTAYGRQRSTTRYGDYYITTLIDTKGDCISLAYATWIIYSTLYDYRYLTDHNKLRNYINNNNIKYTSLEQFDHVTIFNYKELNNIDPWDTVRKPYIYYSKEHAEIIMHKCWLPKVVQTYLNYLAKPGYNKLILPRKLNSSINNYTYTLDIETVREINGDIITHTPYLVSYALDNIGYKLGHDCIEQVFNMINNIYIPGSYIILWTHYGSGYDMHLMLDILANLADYSKDNPVITVDTDQSLISITIKMTRCTIELRDSFMILPASLDDLCKCFNTNSKKIYMDSTKFTYDSFSDPNVINYAITDATALREILVKYRDICLNNGLPNPLNFCTITSMCKNLLLSKYLKHMHCPIYELNRSCHDFIRQSYKGGIVKCYKPGLHKGLYIWDIKSAYANAATNNIPAGSPKEGYYGIIIDNISKIPHEQCFIRCHIIPNKSFKYTTKPHIYHNYDGQQLEEQEGVYYIQTIYSKEIVNGLKHGYKYKSYNYVAFSGSEPFLRDFNNEIYKLKQDAENVNNLTLRTIYKNILTSSYGSFGFNKYNKRVMRIYPKTEYNILRCAAIQECGEGDYKILDKYIYCIQNVDIDIDGTNVAISSAIASYARIQLFELSKTIEDLGYTIYYCDTDAVITNMEYAPINNPLLGNKLGQAERKHIGWVNIECNIYKKKLLTNIYRNPITGEHKYLITCKGINTNKVLKQGTSIEISTNYDKKLLIDNMKQAYLDNKDLNIKQAQIYSGRLNIINNLPRLYEKIIDRKIKLT